jgi:hypothetical protein
MINLIMLPIRCKSTPPATPVLLPHPSSCHPRPPATPILLPHPSSCHPVLLPPRPPATPVLLPPLTPPPLSSCLPSPKPTLLLDMCSQNLGCLSGRLMLATGGEGALNQRAQGSEYTQPMLSNSHLPGRTTLDRNTKEYHKIHSKGKHVQLNSLELHTMLIATANRRTFYDNFKLLSSSVQPNLH